MFPVSGFFIFFPIKDIQPKLSNEGCSCSLRWYLGQLLQSVMGCGSKAAVQYLAAGGGEGGEGGAGGGLGGPGGEGGR